MLYIIKNCEGLDDTIISFLNNNYILSKDDFFNIIENNKLKVYNQLLNCNYLENERLSEYLKTNKIINEQLKNGTIEYYYINNFYSEKKEDILYQRLLMLTKNDKSIANEYKINLEEHIKNINIIIKDNTIYNYLKIFFPESQKNVITQLEIIKKEILENNLIYYTTIEKDYLEIKNKFEKQSQEILSLINNKVFMNVFNILKKKNKLV